MSNVLLIQIVTVLYAGQFFVSLWKHDWAIMLMMLGFVIANIGIIYGAK